MYIQTRSRDMYLLDMAEKDSNHIHIPVPAFHFPRCFMHQMAWMIQDKIIAQFLHTNKVYTRALDEEIGLINVVTTSFL